MGWTGIDNFYCVFTKDGKIDRKRTIDREFESFGTMKVLKSSMIGTVHYCAMQRIRKCLDYDNKVYEDIPENERQTFAVVTLTSISDGWFYYKEISEDMGPCEDRCPNSILSLLSETDSEAANEWRDRCRANLKSKKNGLSALPIGSRIRFKTISGKEYTLIKREPFYQFKTAWYQIEGECHYYPKKHIPNDYEVLTV